MEIQNLALVRQIPGRLGFGWLLEGVWDPAPIAKRRFSTCGREFVSREILWAPWRATLKLISRMSVIKTPCESFCESVLYPHTSITPSLFLISDYDAHSILIFWYTHLALFFVESEELEEVSM